MCLCEQTHIVEFRAFVVRSQIMKLPMDQRPGHDQGWAGIIFAILALWFTTSITHADPPPGFAFSIDASRIPGGWSPYSLATDATGNIYAATFSSVVKVAPTGNYLSHWGTQGTGPGQFAYPGPLAFDRQGNSYVADPDNNRIEKFDANGKFLTQWGALGTNPGQLNNPDGVALNSAGQVFVSDCFNNCIHKFSGTGSFLGQFGSAGTNAGQFSNPGVITFDGNDNLYVVDSPGGSFNDFRVQKFDSTGHFLLQWSSYGPNGAGSIEVAGIAADATGNVYVVDGPNNRIQKFTSNGTFLTEWGELGTGPGQFNSPAGITLDPTGNYVFVPDYYNARIQVFAYQALNPMVFQSPTNVVVPAGANLLLTAGVFGAKPIRYQWQYGGATIPDATNSNLLIPGVSLAASGGYSLTAANSFGVTGSSNAMITVLPLVATTLPVSGVSATGADFRGQITLGSNPSVAWFEWGGDTNYGNLAGFTNLAANVSMPIGAAVSPLSGQLTYHYRVAGSNSLGVVLGNDVTFQVGLAPTAVTLPAQPDAVGNVLLNASVNSSGRATSVFFRWGGPNSLALQTPALPVGDAAIPLAVQSRLAGLTAGQIYSFQVVASNALGTASGAALEFILPPWSILPVPPAQEWRSLAVSADGRQVAGIAGSATLLLSSDTGQTWSLTNLAGSPLHSITISADGKRLVVGGGGPFSANAGPVYYSTNRGISWAKSSSANHNWYAMAASGDGLSVAAADPFAQQVLISTNGGQSWTTNSPGIPANWSALAASADGRTLIIAAGGLDAGTNGPLYLSRNGGQLWSEINLGNQYWRSVAASADGRTLLAAVGGQHSGPIYLSRNAGSSWVALDLPLTNWQQVTVSADGNRMAAISRSGSTPVYTSSDAGQSWHPQLLPAAIWAAIASSADGFQILAAGDQNIFELTFPPSPRLETGIQLGQPSLSWIIPSAQFHLEQTSNLFPPEWIAFPNAPTFISQNLHFQVLLTATNPAVFYRLRNP